ncbi:TIGR01777 family oxidoreductase [Sphingobacterium bovisgrunnientis]|uniref:TIGR01777 family oxidoreductase n=1 Tax=Sphingobacterium bovisgrunnientis TaxID=1874697 RepID=UPI001359E871|nr:TIGR01777 family oxidoreductase [Sphingobacterium bovisgrunnientis]
MKKLIIAGSTGFVGKYLIMRFTSYGYNVVTISRNYADIIWEDFNGIKNALEDADLLINLAGKSVNCRYNETNKAEIFSSRTETTETLGKAILQCQNPPRLWINASTATIYRHAIDRPMTEKNGEIGTGFSVEVAQKWEKSFFDFQLQNTRQVALRMAIVLGADGGVMTPFENLVKFGLGGKQGNGKQMFSWIHVEDLFQIIQFVETESEIKGVINCSAPEPVTNEDFMRIFREVKNIPIGLPSLTWMLKIGALIIGTETELLLKSRWVLPEKLINKGFKFEFPTIESALQDILVLR